MPSDVRVRTQPDFSAEVTWRLNQNMPDQAADELLLGLFFMNRSLATTQRLAGDAGAASLRGLIPGHSYQLMLSAVNVDGNVTTDVTFTSEPGKPSISSLDVERRNKTFFVIDVYLGYTGGGVIAAVDVFFRPTAESRLETPLLVDYQHISPLTLRVVIILTDGHQQQPVEQEADRELTFKVQVQNSHSLTSVRYINGEYVLWYSNSGPCILPPSQWRLLFLYPLPPAQSLSSPPTLPRLVSSVSLNVACVHVLTMPCPPCRVAAFVADSCDCFSSDHPYHVGDGGLCGSTLCALSDKQVRQVQSSSSTSCDHTSC
jgi:hypothetical protein